MLAGVGAGIYRSLKDAAVMRGAVEQFAPKIAPELRARRLEGWAQAVARTLS
jgi:glycerol kinase